MKRNRPEDFLQVSYQSKKHIMDPESMAQKIVRMAGQIEVLQAQNQANQATAKITPFGNDGVEVMEIPQEDFGEDEVFEEGYGEYDYEYQPRKQQFFRGRGRGGGGRGGTRTRSKHKPYERPAYGRRGSTGSQGQQGRGRGRGHPRGRGRGRVGDMSQSELANLIGDAILNYDVSKSVTSKEVILTGLGNPPQGSTDTQMAFEHLKQIEPALTLFEIDYVQRFRKPDDSATHPLKVAFKRETMAMVINEKIDLAGDDLPWARRSLTWKQRVRNQFVLDNVKDLNSRLPTNSPMWWVVKSSMGNLTKKYVQNPNFKPQAKLPVSNTPTASGVVSNLANTHLQIAALGPNGVPQSIPDATKMTAEQRKQMRIMLDAKDQEEAAQENEQRTRSGGRGGKAK